jgi:tRNA threonylcarbamoyladenosine biosynthesis protein TsaE
MTGTPDMSDTPAEVDRTIETRSEEETALLGRLLGEMVGAGDVVALSGGLGAGKTVLVHGLARGLGILEPIPSPTFNLLLVHAATPPLYHFDLYRLERASQLEDIDFYATLESDGVSVIEWADRFVSELPDDRIDIHIDVPAADRRRLTIHPTGPRSGEVASALGRAWDIVTTDESEQT